MLCFLTILQYFVTIRAFRFDQLACQATERIDGAAPPETSPDAMPEVGCHCRELLLPRLQRRCTYVRQLR